MAVAYNPKIVTDGLSFFIDPANPKSYPGSGTTINKLVNISPTATASMVNGVTYSTDNKGIMTFNGTTQYIRSDDRNLGAGLYPFSSGGWFRTEKSDGTSQALVINLNIGSSSVYWALFIANSGILSISRRNTTAYTDASTYTPVIGEWFYAHANFPSTTTAEIYVNGELDTAFTGLTAVTSSTGANDVLIGLLRISSPTWYLDGSCGPVMIYSKSLTAAEVKQNYLATKGRYGL